MCGIVGYFRKNTVKDGALDQALLKLAHRGPDDTGTYYNDSMALGQTRLSIIDLAGGKQPLFSADGKLVLVANGEIYNFIELREDLERKGHRFLTRSDSEVIIHCYAQYGEGFIEHLNGMFAFALYDLSRKRMILARDRLGIKPLFLAHQSDGLVFGSELKAILPLLDSSPDINPNGLLQYLQNQFSTGPLTILNGIERLMPGEAVAVEAGEIVRRWKYWSALDVESVAISYSEAQEEFDSIIDTVMIQHMRSDVPFGLFLSGGVDSAVLLAMLSQYRDEPIRTFSVGFPGTRLTDELPLAKEMSMRFSSSHEEIRPSEKDIFQILPLTVWAADELMRDYASLPTCLLSKRAGSELKVVFSGEGGDEVFAGYGRYRMPRPEKILKSLLYPGSGGFRTRGTFRSGWPRKLFGAALREVGHTARSPFLKAWSETPPAWSDLQKMQYMDLVTAMPDNLLVKADRMMMAWGLEGRVPFLDHRIVEFGLSLPDDLKVMPHQGKLFLKNWATKSIPKDHLMRKKKGFHVPVSEWMGGAFLDRLTHVLPKHQAVTQWFRSEGVKELISKSSGSPIHSRMLFAILQFALWHSLFVQGTGERPPDSMDPLELLG